MLNVNVEAVAKLRAEFREMQKRIGNPKVLMDVLGAKGSKNVVQHFDAEEGPMGPWAPLKNPRRSGGAGILKDTGRLRAAVRFRTTGQADAEVFNQVSYAAYHEHGTENMPRRKFMWIDRQTRDGMRKSMIRWILKGLAN